MHHLLLLLGHVNCKYIVRVGNKQYFIKKIIYFVLNQHWIVGLFLGFGCIVCSQFIGNIMKTIGYCYWNTRILHMLMYHLHVFF